MTNPLYSFRNQMIEFEIYRNSQLISKVKGLKNSYQGRVFIEFFPDTDIQVGDILVNSNIKYYITDIDTQTWMGQISAIKAFYQTNPPAQQNGSTVFNINSASNSIIGNQQSAILNNSSFDIDDLNKLIELHGADDKKQLYELSDQLKTLLEKDDFHKSSISKFSDLIAKHSWLPAAIAQIISSFIQISH